MNLCLLIVTFITAKLVAASAMRQVKSGPLIFSLRGIVQPCCW